MPHRDPTWCSFAAWGEANAIDCKKNVPQEGLVHVSHELRQLKLKWTHANAMQGKKG
jgi:hypothetical protein